MTKVSDDTRDIPQTDWLVPQGIDRSHPQPLYEQIKDAILEMIDRIPLNPHDQIPSERELSERLGVNRLTVRKAIDSLVSEGVLFRQQGKGTYVSPPKLTQPLFVLRSFTDAMLQEGRVPGTRVLRVNLRQGSSHVCHQLQIPRLSPVFELVRVRSVDEIPIALFTSYIPYDLTSNLTPADFEAPSLYGILRDKCGITLKNSLVSIEPTVANHAEAEVLEVQPGQPLILMSGQVFIENGRIIEYCKALYRGDKVRFVVQSD